MKKIITIILAAACMTSAAGATRIPARDRFERQEIRRALRSGEYYLETHTTVRLMPHTDKTPRWLRRRSTVIFLRKHAADSAADRNVNVKTI